MMEEAGVGGVGARVEIEIEKGELVIGWFLVFNQNTVEFFCFFW